MKTSRLLFTNRPAEALDALLAEVDTRGGLFVIADTNTNRLVVDRLAAQSSRIAAARRIVIEPGDSNKTVEALAAVWHQMSDAGATRHAVAVNIGGGVVTDLGGMAAATFKRGIEFINVPTTLLGAVDAAVGGKTGVNLGNLKNEVGVFAPAKAVVVSACFFDTLPTSELLSGYGEMIKHALLDSEEEFNRLVATDVTTADADTLLALLEKSVEIKRQIVAADPTEKGIRRALNLGHTAGHAVESLMLKRGTPIAHGHAVAAGMLVTMLLSRDRLDFPRDLIYRYVGFFKATFGASMIDCKDYDELLALMGHDKKNVVAGEVSFTLLRRPGEPVIDVVVPRAEIVAALDLFQDLIG